MRRAVFAPGARRVTSVRLDPARPAYHGAPQRRSTRRRLRQELHAIAPSPAAALLISVMLLCVAAGAAFVIERLLP